MNDIYCKLLKNETMFVELASKQFSDSTDITKFNIKDVLQSRGKAIREIIDETNAIINEHIKPYMKNPKSLTKELACDLEELASALSSYKANIDTGLACDLRQILTDYYKDIDDESYVRNMFYKGLSYFYLDLSLFKYKMDECYEEVISFSPRYSEFSKETRNLIARAYGNSYISLPRINITEIYERYDRALDFWQTTVKEVDPDFPIDAYIRNLHENLCSTTIANLRSNLDIITDYHKERLLQSASELEKFFLKNKKHNSYDYTSTELKTLNFLATSKYYNNLITLDELINLLYDIYKQADDSYTYDNLYRKLHISSLLLFYLNKILTKSASSSLHAIVIKDIEEDVFNYLMHIPNDLSRSHVAMLTTNFAVGSNFLFDDYSYLKTVLSMTVFRHPPTYAHSVMVAKIAFVIVEYIAKYHPEELVGLPGFNHVDDIEKNISEIMLFVWFSGLLHDIGKIKYSHLVSFYVRSLNDNEFELIKQHTNCSKSFMKSTPDFSEATVLFEAFNSSTNLYFSHNPELFSCFADIAMGHHKSYDGTFGYPEEFDILSSPVKIIIDVITIADSIDAATDSIGRNYAHEKSLECLKDEVLSQTGTRYSPFVADLVFNNEELYNKIHDILENFRYDVYYSSLEIKNLQETITPPNMELFK